MRNKENSESKEQKRDPFDYSEYGKMLYAQMKEEKRKKEPYKYPQERAESRRSEGPFLSFRDFYFDKLLEELGKVTKNKKNSNNKTEYYDFEIRRHLNKLKQEKNLSKATSQRKQRKPGL